MSDCRCVSDCRYRGRQFDPGLVPYIHGDCDHEMISTAILLPSPNSRRVVVSYKRKYVHKVLVNGLGPVHMHTFTYVSKVTYVSNFTYGVM